MNKTFLICAAVTGATFIMPAYAADETDTLSSEAQVKTSVEKNEDGSISAKKTTTIKNIDTAGTLSKTKTTVKLDADADGDKEKTVTSETVVDPKGLLNKSKVTTKDSVKVKDGETETKHTKKIDGETVEETHEASPTAR